MMKEIPKMLKMKPDCALPESGLDCALDRRSTPRLVGICRDGHGGTPDRLALTTTCQDVWASSKLALRLTGLLCDALGVVHEV